MAIKRKQVEISEGIKIFKSVLNYSPKSVSVNTKKEIKFKLRAETGINTNTDIDININVENQNGENVYEDNRNIDADANTKYIECNDFSFMSQADTDDLYTVTVRYKNKNTVIKTDRALIKVFDEENENRIDIKYEADKDEITDDDKYVNVKFDMQGIGLSENIKRRPMDIVIILDNSGSMRTEDWKNAEEGAKIIVNYMQPEDRALIRYVNRGNAETGFSNDKEYLNEVLMKIVSVIVPCHNAAKWLPQCFLSLVQQSIGMDALELIFVDDASDDAGETWALLEEFERAYPESIMIIHLEDNLRQGGARNVALGYATGEYLAFVDADDFVEGDFFEKVYRRAIERDADIVQFDYVYYTERLGKVASGRKTVEESIRIQTKEERKRFLVSEKITYGCWNKLYRRSLVERAGVRYAEHVIYEEPLFVYPLLFYGSRFEIMAEAFYCYRQNEVGTMRRDMRQMTTLQMHADVQLAVWHFMKQTPFFREYYEEIKLYFLHTYFYETLLFAVQRGFEVPYSMYETLRDTVRAEVADYQESPYAAMIPRQMELYRVENNRRNQEEIRYGVQQLMQKMSDTHA